MEHITVTQESPARRAAVAGLAVVGFFALVFIGMVLAIYAARFVPKAANGLSSAAVYLGSVFSPADAPTLETVPQTVPFDNSVVATTTATSTAPVATTTPVTTPVTQPKPSAGAQTTIVIPTGGTTATTLYGDSDLTVDITAVGYLTSSDTNSFVASTEVPSGKRGAMKFTVKNVGTNTTGSWNFDATIPSGSDEYTYHSSSQQSLKPDESIQFTLGFDRAEEGSQTVSVEVDPNDKVSESNERNNTSDADIRIED